MTHEKPQDICDSEYGDSPNNFRVSRFRRTLAVTLTYPSVTVAGVTHVELDQESVRASDGIRLHYDYARDGWVVEQPTKMCWNGDDPDIGDMGWTETAFVPSWQLRDEQEAHEKKLDERK